MFFQALTRHQSVRNLRGFDPLDLWRVRGHKVYNYFSVMSSVLEPKIARLELFRAIRFPCENTTMTSLHHLATSHTHIYTNPWSEVCEA